MILTLKQLYFNETWILPQREAWEEPDDALRIEAPCPDGDEDECVYYVFTLKPLTKNLTITIKNILTLIHYNGEDEDLLINVANALITVHNSNCYELVTPAKLIYEMALKHGLEIKEEEVETEEGGREVYYHIRGVGTVRKTEKMSKWCAVANKEIEPHPVVKWIF